MRPAASHPARHAARLDLARLHQALWRRQRQTIDETVEPANEAFLAYEEAYERAVRRYRAIVHPRAVVDRASEADLVFVGDYHTLARSQRTYVDLVRALAGRGRPLVLALEFVPSNAQAALDAYLRGRIAEATFLRRIRYPEGHGFPLWPNFRPILEAARELGLPVVALDLPEAGLALRDAHAAERLLAALQAHAGAQVVALMGQLHVAPPHVPAAASRLARAAGHRPPSRLVIYQNCENIYWQLVAEGLEHTVHAVEVGRRELCLVHTSPVVAQQSYLAFLHHDDPLDPSLDTAPEHTFHEMCSALCAFLELEPGEAADRVTVCSIGDLGFLEDLRASGRFTGAELRHLRRQALESESFYVPRAQLVYLATTSVNHAAEEAAHFLRHVLTEDDGAREGLVDAFYARTVHEALAFFGSKVINPRRRCAHERDLNRLIRRWDTGSRRGLVRSEIDAARLALTHLRIERGERIAGLRKLYEVQEADLFNAVTHLLGYQLGDKLYYGMLKGKTTKEEIREVFLDPMDEPGEARAVYFHLVERVGNTRIPRPPRAP